MSCFCPAEINRESVYGVPDEHVWKRLQGVLDGELALRIPAIVRQGGARARGAL